MRILPAVGLMVMLMVTSAGGKQTDKPAVKLTAAIDCGLEVDGRGLPDIRERAKKWLMLKPGQNYEARRPLAMGVDTNAHGTYEFHVVYDGPSATPDDDQKLKDAGIAVPSGRFESDKLTYKITAPKS